MKHEKPKYSDSSGGLEWTMKGIKLDTNVANSQIRNTDDCLMTGEDTSDVPGAEYAVKSCKGSMLS